ncbi:MAG: hypothetical protein K2N48_01405 [Muribaculaceae bacterium]|nr:hypothetical protein [Muribaculaceae bacterium]
MKKIIRKIKEVYDKWLHKRRCRAIWGRKFDAFYSDGYVSKKGRTTKEQAIAMFRQMFVEAYPEMASFADKIQMMQGYKDVFELKGSLCASGHLSAYGLSTTYREWEDNTIKEIERKYPDLKILVFRCPHKKE